MLVVTRFSVAEAEGEGFAGQVRTALEAFAARPGYLRGRLGRAVDDPTNWLLLTEWDGVGSYRRALSAYDVRLAAIPLLATAEPGPGGYEVLLAVGGAGTGGAGTSGTGGTGTGGAGADGTGTDGSRLGRSDRAADADTTGPGQFARTPEPRPRPAASPRQPERPAGEVASPPGTDDRTGQEMP